MRAPAEMAINRVYEKNIIKTVSLAINPVLFTHFVAKFSHGDQEFKKQLHPRDTLTCADYASVRIINVI